MNNEGKMIIADNSALVKNNLKERKIFYVVTVYYKGAVCVTNSYEDAIEYLIKNWSLEEEARGQSIKAFNNTYEEYYCIQKVSLYEGEG